jgi:guanine deaminase
MDRHRELGIPVALGTDIGAGTHLSLWSELAEAYKVQRLLGHTPGVADLLYLGTLGGARALGLGEETGNFDIGKSADFFLLAPQSDTYLTERLQYCADLQQELFCLMHLATPSQVQATYLAGRQVYGREQSY